MKKFSQNFGKIAECGVVYSEGQNATKAVFQTGYGMRGHKRVWETSQQAKSVRQAVAQTGRFTEKGTLFLCLL